MAESLVASSIQWIGSLLVQEASLLFDVTDQIRGLQEDLELMQQFLQDADSKQEIKEIRALIRQIRKLAYDAEDVIDTYILEVQAGVARRKGWFLKSTCFLYTAPHAYSLGKQIQLMQNNVKRITDSLTDSGVRRITKAGEDLRSSSNREKKRPLSYPYDDEGEFIVGLEKDIKILVEVLMGEGNTLVNFVSIVGMGGSGKTTLARKLYNHPYAKECFDCFAWVCISQVWSTRHVLSEILRKISSPTEMSKLNPTSSMEELVDKLHCVLEKKSYLVVLDDVWRREALEEILPALPRVSNNKGSKIIITTRNQEVVQFQNLQRNLYVHEPRLLSEEESWELFCKIAFNYHTDYNNESYESLGNEMLEKCDGLPLAIVALAGILNTKKTIREWQQVSEAVRSKVMEGTCTHLYGKVGDMLALSYDDLPYDLKPCFLYLGVFPEDCQIPAGMLTRMWIAEGLIPSMEEMSLEDVAMQRLEELSQRFMIQVVRTNSKGAIKAIHVHDLLREICLKKAKELSFLEVNSPITNFTTIDAYAMTIESRRAALHSRTSFPVQASALRSLILMTRSSVMHSDYISKESLDMGVIHQNFKLLRLLNLWGIKTHNGILPTQIGNLIHLRYIGIRASNITELPLSIGNLRNLLTLDYRNIESDVKVTVPNIFGKLPLLRHLFLPIECPWIGNSLQLSALKNLQILWGVKCVEGDCYWFLEEMPQLSPTLKKLKVFVSTEKHLEAAFSCPSIKFDQLQTFHCELESGMALRVKRVLSHNLHLHKLVLVGKIGVDKLSLILPSNLLMLELKDSVLEDEDPMVVAGALTHLKHLRLSNSYMGSACNCQPDSFPKLEELYLDNLDNLTRWEIEKGAMSSLKKLEILICRKMQFPHGLASVTTLQQLDYFRVSPEFNERAQQYGWSQERYRLPHNFEAIMEQCDMEVDMSSIHKLYEVLTTGIFLGHNHKKFWILKHEDHTYNCFMVYVADDFFFATTHDIDGFPEWYTTHDFPDFPEWYTTRDFPEWYTTHDAMSSFGPKYEWKWTKMEESKDDDPLIKVVELNREVVVIYVRGGFDISNLSPGVKYTFSFMIMVDDSKAKEEMHLNTKLNLPNGSVQVRSHTMNDKPKNEWLKIFIGELETHCNVIGVAVFTLHCRWRLLTKVGFAVKGVVIEPKL